ncbi:MAG: 2'-5' RNA ligase family protein [Halanaerobiaceae bacterium]
MLKKADLNEELFIVLLLNGDVLKELKRIQKLLLDHYKLYDKGIYPELHITIDRIPKNCLCDAKKIIKKVVNRSKPVKIELDKYVCYHQSHQENFLVLETKDTISLKKFSRDLHEELSRHDLSTIDDYEKWQYHITILSSMFARKPLTDQDFEGLCWFLEGKEKKCESYSDEIEIWSPTLDDDEKCIATFKI